MAGAGHRTVKPGGAAVMLNKLNYLWRLLGTGIGFAVFSVGGLIMAVTLFPLLAITAPDVATRESRIRRLIHAGFRGFVGLLTLLGVIEFNTEGCEQLLACEGDIIIANHPSLLDVVLLMSLLPEAQCVVKHQLWGSRFLGSVVRGAGYIRNDLPVDEMIAECQQALDQGTNMVLFPEGTRTVPGKPIKFQRGFANIATLCEADLQLVTIRCTPPTLLKGESWYQIPDEKMKFSLVTHEKIKTRDYLENNLRTIAVRRLTRDMEQLYQEKLCNG